MSTEERVRKLAPLKDRVLDRAEAIAKVVREEIGKPEVEALLGEVLPTADVVAYWTSSDRRAARSGGGRHRRHRLPGEGGTLEREARGRRRRSSCRGTSRSRCRCGRSCRRCSRATRSSSSRARCRRKSGALVAELFEGLVPEGLVGIVQGGGRGGRGAVRGGRGPRGLHRAASATGRKVAHACAERLIPCSLELGGKDAAIVLADANLERAAQRHRVGRDDERRPELRVGRARVRRAARWPRRSRRRCARSWSRSGRGSTSGRSRRRRSARSWRATWRRRRRRGAKVLAGQGRGEGEATRDYPPTVMSVEDDETPLMTRRDVRPGAADRVVDGRRRGDRARERLALRADGEHVDEEQEAGARRWRRKLRAGVVTINNHGFTGALPHGAVERPRRDGLGHHQLAARARHAHAAALRARWTGAAPSASCGGTRTRRRSGTIALAMATLRSGTPASSRSIGALFRLLGAMLEAPAADD